MAVRVIPAQMQMSAPSATEKKKLRVAGYARVSTDLEEQESSYEAQVDHFTELINNNPAWTLVEVYADEGISATSTVKRVNFNRMIADCENHLIDMVITKSISRWARNTLDSLQYIRKLKGLGIPIVFEKEGINTMDASGELLITILSSLAQQESESISQNVRLGIQYKFQRGKPMLTHTRFIGYTKETKGGDLVIDPAGAEIVRRIFRDFLDGMTIGEIAEGLTRDGVKAPGGEKWYHGTILRMLQNEKFQGDLLLQKSFVADFLTKKRRRNHGELPQYYVENAHQPIVPREVFMIVQGELLRRQQKKIDQGKKHEPTYKYALKGKVVCAECGAIYLRTTSSRYPPIWRCQSRLTKGLTCGNRAVKEERIQNTVVLAINSLPEHRDELLCLRERLRWGKLDRVDEELVSTENRVREIEHIISEYAKDGTLPAGIKDPDAFLESLRIELKALNEKKDGLLTQKAELAVQLSHVRAVLELIDAIMFRRPAEVTEEEGPACYTLDDFYRRTNRALPIGPVVEYSDELLRRFVDQICICQNRFRVRFKCGVEITAG